MIAALEVELHDLRADLELCKAALVVAARGLSRELAVDDDRAGPSAATSGCCLRRHRRPLTGPSQSDPTAASERFFRGPQES